MSVKQEVLNALLLIQRNGPTQREYGICCSVIDYYNQAHPEKDPEELEEDADVIDDMLLLAMGNWPKHSGNPAYPIADPEGKRTNSSYFWDMSVDKWDLNTEAGLLRLDLLSFTIAQLQIQLSKT